jgi:NADH-ubiquinone oxidoreductase chain 5
LIKLLPAILSLLGAILAIYFYNYKPEFIVKLTENLLGRKLYTYLNGKYLFDVLYNQYIIAGGLHFAYSISKFLDKGVIELIGPNGLSNTLIKTGINISKLDTGIITTYSLYITLTLLFLLFIIFSPILINISLLNELRLFIIYLSTLILVLSYFLLSKKN